MAADSRPMRAGRTSAATPPACRPAPSPGRADMHRPWTHLIAMPLLWASGFSLTACAPPSASRADDGQGTLSTGGYQEQGQEQGLGRRGGTIRMSVATDTGTLDLHAISATNAQWLGRLIFDNLVYLDEQGNPTPWLATDWTISPDGKTYVFHLRQGVTFSDGAPFDAEAVRVNLEHMRDPRTKSPLAAAYIAPYVSGRVIDRYTFEATLSQPYAPFLHVLAQSWLAMMSPRAIREHPETLASQPVGSGPFVVERYVRQQALVLRRRADYDWAPPYLRHHGPAYVDRIEVAFVPEPLIRAAALVSGQYDFTIDAPPQDAAQIRRDPGLVLDNRVRTGIVARAIAFNVEKFPFTDPRVRRALAMAVDRHGLAQVSGFGAFHEKSDFLASNTRAWDAGAGSVIRFDPAAANRLLDEAGWTARDADGIRMRDGRRLAAEVLVTEGAGFGPVIVATQADFRRVGFDLRIVQLTLPQMTARRLANDYQALGSGVWHTNTPDALFINYASAEIPSPARIGQNTARLHDEELDALLARARETIDPAAQTRLYAAAQRRLAWLAPGIPLYENHSLTARRADLHGVLFDTSHNTPIFTAAWLEHGR